MSVLVATAYMEEAERFDWLICHERGEGTGDRIAGRTQDADWRGDARGRVHCAASEEQRGGHQRLQIRRPHRRAEPVIIARDLTCRFGDFTAVDRVSFTIERGEIFGFVGSNGCGKTTTMKMLTGLLPPSEGEALLFGKPLEAGDMSCALSRRLHVAVVLALYRAHGPAEPRASRASFPSAGAKG